MIIYNVALPRVVVFSCVVPCLVISCLVLSLSCLVLSLFIILSLLCTQEGQHVRAALFHPVPSRPTPTTTRFLVLSCLVLSCPPLVLSCLSLVLCQTCLDLCQLSLVLSCLLTFFFPSIARA